MEDKGYQIEGSMGFPSHSVPDEIKSTPEFGLAMARAIESEWFHRPSGGDCTYQSNRDKFHSLRLYARGEQDTKIYKDMISPEDTSYTNFDWRPLQIIPKFVKLIVNQMSERLFEIKAEATDKFSTDLKNNYKKNMERFVVGKPMMKQALQDLGVNVFPDDYESYPESKEEIDLFMQLKYKPAIEIATEEAIKFTLGLNDYEETQQRVIEDITVLGIGAVKQKTDPSKGIVVDYVDPANLVYSYPRHRDYRDCYYYGEVRRITINELKRISDRAFTQEELVAIARNSASFARNNGETNEFGDDNGNRDVSGYMVDIMDFNFRSTNTLTYKKKFSKNGGYIMKQRESTFTKGEYAKEYDAVKRNIDVWYEGILILGCGELINYKMSENMIRPEGLLNMTQPNYSLYSPELYQNRTKSTVERIIPYVDQMQQIHIKIQQMIAKVRPNGIFIDIDGLNEIDMGDGTFLTPMDNIKMYNETGNIFGSGRDAEGNFNYSKVPFQELNNGVVQGLERLTGMYNHYLNLLRDAIGVPEGADASTPNPKMLVGVQQQLALNSNTATRHILDASLSISKRVGLGVSLRLKDIFMYSELKEVYINAIGALGVEILDSIKNYHLHDMGVLIELKPDTDAKQQLEQNIQIALSEGSITLDDIIDIRGISNIKLANELIKVRRVKREKMKNEQQEKMAKIQTEAQIQSAQTAAQSAMDKIQAESQAKLALVQAEAEAASRKINEEKEAKLVLMEREYQYNLVMRGIESEATVYANKLKEDKKDARQNKQNTDASKMIEQRHNNGSPIDFSAPDDLDIDNVPVFESGVDNIEGGVSMEGFEPVVG